MTAKSQPCFNFQDNNDGRLNGLSSRCCLVCRRCAQELNSAEVGRNLSKTLYFHIVANKNLALTQPVAISDTVPRCNAFGGRVNRNWIMAGDIKRIEMATEVSKHLTSERV